MEALKLAITLISIILFLWVYWIQASSNSLINMMRMQNKKIINEIEFGINTEELDRENIIEVLSYFNLVSKLYLNHSININMLRTFEGVMIKLLNAEITGNIYREIYIEFHDEIKTAEPPYINLIYATDMLVNLNKILNKRSFFSPLHAWFYRMYRNLNFSIRPSSKSNWKLASKLFKPSD